jgi:coenzyme F420-reducing hydrogenase alpha subunit
MIAECRHVMPSGLHCQAIAMRGTVFCYHHARTQAPARAKEVCIEIPDRLDSKGALFVIQQIVTALGCGAISARRAGVLLHGVQMASGKATEALSPLLPNICK